MINIIACVDNNFGIGKDNDLLIKIPQDMEHFKRETIGNVCVFGRKTAESLPNKKPLRDRENIILTRDTSYELEGFKVTNKPSDILDLADENHVYICGGAEIYKLFIPHADNIILTSVSESYDADTFFPYASMGMWVAGAIDNDLSITNDQFELDIEGIEAGNYEQMNYNIMKYTRRTKGDNDHNE